MYWVPEDGRRKRGWPKKTWRSTFRDDLEEMGVSWSGACRTASDWTCWKLLFTQCSERKEELSLSMININIGLLRTGNQYKHCPFKDR